MLGIKFEPREVILAHFPFETKDKTKVEKNHPTLVISKSTIVYNNDIYICLPITSNPSPDPHKFEIKNNNMQEGQLKILPSWVVCDLISAISKERAVMRIGRVKQEYYDNVVQKIKKDILEL